MDSPWLCGAASFCPGYAKPREAFVNGEVKTELSKISGSIALRVAGVDLSPRSLQVFELLISGYTYKDMMQKLNMSRSTVNWHASKIFARFGIPSGGQKELLRKLGTFKVTVEWIPKENASPCR